MTGQTFLSRADGAELPPSATEPELPTGLRGKTIGRVQLFWRPASVTVALVLGLCAILLGVTALFIGTLDYPVEAVMAWAARQDSTDTDMALVLGQLRLPRILLALLSGAMLGLAGAAMQSMTRNALADPGLLGIKEGAIAALLLAGAFAPALPESAKVLTGIAGGCAVAGFVTLIAGRLSGLRLILAGIGTGWALSSLITLFMVTADLDHARAAMIWMAGSLHAASWQGMLFALPWAVIGTALLVLTIRPANLAEGGPVLARGLGVGLGRLTLIRLAAAVLLTSAATATIGSLGFVGLIAPHLARLLTGPRQLALLTGSALAGALITLAADTAGRVLLAPVQIPAGIVTALIGVPFFLILLWQRRGQL